MKQMEQVQIPKSKTRKKQIAPKQPKSVGEWLQAKVKYPGTYKVTPEGMLISPPSKSGDSEIIIPLEPRVFATAKHISNEFEKRSLEIKEAEEQFTEARRNLQRITDAYRQGSTSASDVVIANQQVKEAETFLVEKAINPRTTVTIDPSPTVRDILLENRYLVNKVADPVYIIKRATFPWTYFYAKPEDLIEVEEVENTNTETETNTNTNRNREKSAEERARIAAIIRARKKRVVFPS